MSDIADALRFIPADDRDTWVRMGMAIKSELGNAGWDVWAQWSENDSSWRERDARAVWKSIRSHGGIGIGSLYHLARQGGWTGTEPTPSPIDYAKRRAERAAEDRRFAEQQEREWNKAAERAQKLVSESAIGTHQYLAEKGFPDERGLIHGQALLIPMRSMDNRKVQSIQQIWRGPEGFLKKFLPGGRARGAVFAIGSEKASVLCEGYATGLSIREALRAVYWPARVVVCFSAGNLAHVAKRIGGFVVADNDASGAGQKAAESTGLPWWMPPDTGTDANDFHLAHGARALARELNQLRRAA